MINIQKIIIQMLSELPFTSVTMFIVLVLQSVIPAITLTYLNALASSIQQSAIYENIPYLIIYLLLSIIVPFILSTFFELLQLRIQRHMDRIISSRVLLQTQKVSITHLESGEDINSMFRASQTRSKGIQHLIFSVIHMILAIVQIIIVTLSIKKPGLYILCIIILFTIPLFFINRYIDNLSLQNSWSTDEKRRKANTLFSVLLSKCAAAELWLYQLRINYFEKYKQQINEINVIDRQNYKHTTKAVLLADVIFQFCFFVILLLIAFLKIFQNYEISLCITLIYASQKLLSFCNTIVNTLVSYSRQKQIIDEYNIVFGWQTESSEELPKTQFDFKSIKLENVSYRYARQKFNALNNINLEIKKGEHIVLVGANGSGKSTLIRLLLGYDVPQKGSCSVDGVPIQNVLKSFWNNTTIMFQKFWKYNLNIKQNIILSDPNNNDILFEDLIEKLELNEIIQKLKNGAETEVINGGLLSGGQWQKIALARTYYRNRPIIVMDEPNAAIDALYELRLYHDLMELFKSKTVILVSHRLPICQLADRVIVMEQGEIVEDGNHHELLKRKGRYYDMFQKQSGVYSI